MPYFKNEKKAREWEQRVKRYRESNLGLKAFCARESLKISTLQYWCRKFPKGNSTLVEIRSAAKETGPIEIVLNDRLKIRIEDNFNPSLLRRVLQALEVSL